MTEKNVYGINEEDTVTPIMVRDAIIQYFLEAHKDCLELAIFDKKMTKMIIIENVKKVLDKLVETMNTQPKNHC
ncbi:MAG: hypothetical protein GW775_01320 [Candidatus Magasanikbacteria bacterium]|uniref:Uncharacterized protein n=1 Tax=Candidatus Magasanikbacteria bacterium CG10_big_fil_rev_8_21_14_0_10_38_6 TaxID=1974647 RepID=A0A2M6P1J6_9BACT|nr:hypothetical protein [Candidatus Magasanikbacteria bacterium]PIR77429.1 MAG: hypothetical protein COU30_02510 [Candidatus Magasanikbacteria bacterium CG10_big_fil_rev_8_21_14_0_10_38_6]